jgi:hypothetical protein
MTPHAPIASTSSSMRFIYAAFSPRSTFCSAGNVEPAVDRRTLSVSELILSSQEVTPHQSRSGEGKEPMHGPQRYRYNAKECHPEIPLGSCLVPRGYNPGEQNAAPAR